MSSTQCMIQMIQAFPSNSSAHIWHCLEMLHISNKQRNHSQHFMKQKNEDTLNLCHFFCLFLWQRRRKKNNVSLAHACSLLMAFTFALLYEQSNTRTRAYENNNSHFRYIKFMIVFVIIEGWMSVNGCWQMPLFLLAFSFFFSSRFAIHHTPFIVLRGSSRKRMKKSTKHILSINQNILIWMRHR